MRPSAVHATPFACTTSSISTAGSPRCPTRHSSPGTTSAFGSNTGEAQRAGADLPGAVGAKIVPSGDAVDVQHGARVVTRSHVHEVTTRTHDPAVGVNRDAADAPPLRYDRRDVTRRAQPVDTAPEHVREHERPVGVDRRRFREPVAVRDHFPIHDRLSLRAAAEARPPAGDCRRNAAVTTPDRRCRRRLPQWHLLDLHRRDLYRSGRRFGGSLTIRPSSRTPTRSRSDIEMRPARPPHRLELAASVRTSGAPSAATTRSAARSRRRAPGPAGSAPDVRGRPWPPGRRPSARRDDRWSTLDDMPSHRSRSSRKSHRAVAELPRAHAAPTADREDPGPPSPAGRYATPHLLAGDRCASRHDHKYCASETESIACFGNRTTAAIGRSRDADHSAPTSV